MKGNVHTRSMVERGMAQCSRITRTFTQNHISQVLPKFKRICGFMGFLADWAVMAVMNFFAILLKYPTFEGDLCLFHAFMGRMITKLEFLH